MSSVMHYGFAMPLHAVWGGTIAVMALVPSGWVRAGVLTGFLVLLIGGGALAQWRRWSRSGCGRRPAAFEMCGPARAAGLSPGSGLCGRSPKPGRTAEWLQTDLRLSCSPAITLPRSGWWCSPSARPNHAPLATPPAQVVPDSNLNGLPVQVGLSIRCTSPKHSDVEGRSQMPR